MKFLVRLSELDFEISMLSLNTLIGLPLDIISKCANILSKPTEPKVSSGRKHYYCARQTEFVKTLGKLKECAEERYRLSRHDAGFN